MNEGFPPPRPAIPVQPGQQAPTDMPPPLRGNTVTETTTPGAIVGRKRRGRKTMAERLAELDSRAPKAPAKRPGRPRKVGKAREFAKPYGKQAKPVRSPRAASPHNGLKTFSAFLACADRLMKLTPSERRVVIEAIQTVCV